MSFPDLSASRPVQGRSFFSFRQVRRLLPAAAVMAVLLPAPPVLRAQTPAPMVQITVTAARLPLAVSDAVAEVTVLDRAAIERAEGLTLSQLLAQQAGFQLNSNGGLGKTSTLFIRGLEARHTLLLIDGVRVGSATVGTPSLDNLPLESIERIEIVRGPMSSLYGNGAMGGVVQLFTRRADTGVSGNAKLAVGSQGYGQAAAGLGFGDGRFDLAAQVQHTRTGGQNATNPSVPFGLYNADRDGWRQTGGSLRAGLQLGAGWRAELVALQATGTTDLDDGPAARAQAGSHDAQHGAHCPRPSGRALAHARDLQRGRRRLQHVVQCQCVRNARADPDAQPQPCLGERLHHTHRRSAGAAGAHHRDREPARSGLHRERARYRCCRPGAGWSASGSYLAGQPAARSQLAVRRRDHRSGRLRLRGHPGLARRRQLGHQPDAAQLQPVVLSWLRQPEAGARGGRARGACMLAG